MKKWYVCYILQNTEKKIQKIINNDFPNVTMIYPNEEIVKIVNDKKKITLKPLFPNYAFVGVDDDEEKISIFTELVSKTPIIKILKMDGKPVQLSKQEVDTFVNAQQIKKEFYYDRKSLLGNSVYITKGPFSGSRGICRTIIKGTDEMGVDVELNNLVIRQRIKCWHLETEDNYSYYEESYDGEVGNNK